MRQLSDGSDNRSSTPPADEAIDWPSFWMAEVYTPSNVSHLTKGLKKLGLDQGERAFQHDLVSWIEDSRGRPGAWASAGFFSQPDTFLTMGATLEVPDEFLFMQFGLHQVASGVTVLVGQFALAEDRRTVLDRTLREEFHAEARPLKGGGHSGHHANGLKEEALGEQRRKIRGAAARWITDNLPGSFTGLGVDLPSWDLLLTQKCPLVALHDTPSPYNWHDTLGYEAMPEIWEADQFSGLELVLPRGATGRTEAVATFFGREDVLLGSQRENERNVHSLAQHLDSALAGLLAAWSVEKVLSAHADRFAQIRDRLAGPENARALRAGRRIRAIRSEVLPMAFDLDTLERGAQDEWTLKLLGTHAETDFFWKGGGRRRATPDEPRRLFSLISERLPETGQSVASQARQISSSLRVQSEFLVAASNLRLQWAVMVVSVVAAVAAVVAVFLAG
jgi:hypothetical protein